ncbi:MAG: hypothetical protein P4L62_03140 [Candidatus Pacebacteria bacterium]|nr:hypothetical protein [Candidatus Paceibacterota bacterium]MDR3583328.1 hypothetical protein [Candidatus Paceibacterota bacterium]
MKSEQFRPEKINKSEWKTETEKHEGGVSDFLKNYLGKDINERPRYDSSLELHFSGTNRVVHDKISQGTANVVSVNIFYVNNKPDQIHIVFDGEHQGHNLDVYLKGKALEDYLGEK